MGKLLDRLTKPRVFLNLVAVGLAVYLVGNTFIAKKSPKGPIALSVDQSYLECLQHGNTKVIDCLKRSINAGYNEQSLSRCVSSYFDYIDNCREQVAPIPVLPKR